MTDKAELEELYLNTYIERLKPNPVKEDLEDIFELKDVLKKYEMECNCLKILEFCDAMNPYSSW